MKNNIVSVTDPEDMEVPYGTEITAEDLPKTLPVQLEGDVQKDLEVTWDLSSYNPEEEGVQTITGTFAETDLIGNPDKVQAEVSVTVLPLHAKYKVTVENGSGSGQYEEGSTVTVKADDPAEGMKFDKWVSEDVEFADAESEETTFVMPSKDVTVTATYKALPDKSALKDAIDKAEKINPDDYTTESTDALHKALEEAKAVYDNADATEAEIEGAMDALNAAVDGMVKLGDKTELQAKLEEAAEVKENLSDYLTEGQEAFLKAYDAAEKVNADPEASETDVTDALKNLTDAMDNLTLKPDKSELADLVEKAKAIDTDKYTDETVKGFRESLSIAEDVLADEEATEAEVSEALARLANAIEQLEEKDTGNPDDGNKPGSGNKPGDGNNPDDGNKPGGGNKPDDGNKPNGGNQSGNGSGGSDAPKTGDTANPAGILAVLILSAGAAAGILYKKKRDI